MSSTAGAAASVTSTAEVQERVRDAAERGAPLRIAGRGTWLDAGRPVRTDHLLSLESLSGVVEYTPGDLTLTARAGTPLDCVLGLETVTGAGAVVRTGGRVVKNVAGFDLTRLFTGSWGTLAVLTEVTVRLRAIPEVDESYLLQVEDAAPALDALLTRLREASLAPLA